MFLWFLLYSFLFLSIGGTLAAYYLDVSPFSFFSLSTKEVFINPFSDWYKLYTDFQHDRWAVDSLENLIIFLVFIFFFPLWLGLWFFVVRRIKFKKFFLKPIYFYKTHFKKKEVIGDKKIAVAPKMTERPAAMRRTNGFGNLSVLADAQQNTQNNEAPVQTSSDYESSSANAPATITAAQKEQLRALGEKYGYELFEKVQLDKMVPFVFATDTVALVTYVMLEKKEWIADETPSEDGDEPTWFSAEGLIPSPFQQMVKAAEFLKEKEPSSEVIPVVVVAEGNILNATGISELWQKMGGAVVLWNNGQGEGLGTLEELLQDKNQTGEESDETEEASESPDEAGPIETEPAVEEDEEIFAEADEPEIIEENETSVIEEENKPISVEQEDIFNEDEIIETADDKIAEEDEIEAIPDVEPLDEDEKNPA